MSKIDKLSIVGVRSFSNRNAEVIQFFSPLTLIVGYNGSGKTTIIECLKYATTGEMPAGAKTGGAWIHDPKLCGEKDILASIRLSFVSTKGDRMFLARNLQLTVKANSRSMKGLESSLTRKVQGEKLVVSSKIAELDSLVPSYLGVSKAVLENVIFCHQDDSLWPMSAPGDLKKKFDDIFEAVKYTKAVEDIRKIRKEYADSLKTLKVIEANAKDYKDKGEKLEKETNDLYEQLEELRKQTESLGNESDDAQARLDECFVKITELSTLQGDLTGKRIQLQTKEENIAKLQRNIHIMQESDQDLQQMLDDYEDRVGVLQTRDEEHRKRYKELNQQIQNTRNSLSVKERELGSLEAQQANHERQIEAREALVKQLARRHAIRGFDLELTEEDIVTFKDKMNKLKKDQMAALERARRLTNEELGKAQANLSGINEKKTGLMQRKDTARSTINANDRKIATFQSDSDRIEVDEGFKIVLEQNISDTAARLEKSKAEFASAGWDRQISKCNTELNSLDTNKDNLDAELVDATKRSTDASRLEYLHKDARDRETSLQTMSDAYGQKIKDILEGDWTITSLESDYQHCHNAKTAAVSEAERQRTGVSNELEQINFKLKSCKNDLKSKIDEASKLERKICTATEQEPSEFASYLADLEEQGEIVTSNTTSAARMASYFTDSIKTAEDHGVCRLCLRQLDKAKELQKFLAKVQADIKKIETLTEKEDQDQLMAELQTAKSLAPAFDTWKRLTEKEIPVLEAEEKKLTVRHGHLVEQMEKNDQLVSSRKEELLQVVSLTKTVSNMVKYHSEATNYKLQIDELSAKMASAGVFRTLDQIREDIKGVNDMSRAAKASLNKISTDRDRARPLINALELESRDLQSKLNSTSYQLREKLSLQKQLDDLKSANVEHRDSITLYDRALQTLGPELGQAQAAYDEIARQGSEKDGQMREEISNVDGSLNRLQTAEQEISDYNARGGSSQLHRVKFSIESMTKEIQDTEQQVSQIAKETNNIQNQLHNNEEIKRSICDNQDYRRDKRDIEQVAAAIAALEAHNVEEEKNYWENQRQQWHNQLTKLTAAQNKVVGQLTEKDDRLQSNLANWETDYKDAAYKYKEAHIRVETTKAAVEDLGRYGSALDNAIMKYHNLKMEEVNRIIDELWRRTYQGTDVDTIMIKSENDSLKGNKSYKYRVSMFKQDAEMDMRGRCSAGQKVLASIIIRLALAECFGVNCGLIALDEPTTNLDHENIQALARALSEIIKVRRQQANFQLIVITHDEEFLRYMQCSDYTDEYYRISRDANQDTQIRKQQIAQVMN